MSTDNFDEHGRRDLGNGDYEVDPTHHENLGDPRWDQARSVWAISHAEPVPTQGEDA